MKLLMLLLLAPLLSCARPTIAEEASSMCRRWRGNEYDETKRDECIRSLIPLLIQARDKDGAK